MCCCFQHPTNELGVDISELVHRFGLDLFYLDISNEYQFKNDILQVLRIHEICGKGPKTMT